MDVQEFRNSTKGVLELISSKEKQLEYKKNVPTTDIPDELFSMWFDAIYHPESELFQNSFSLKEQECLKDFNICFEEQEKHLPQILEEMHESEHWILVMDQAKVAFEEIFNE